MSAMKSFAFGILTVAISAVSALGGSMHPAREVAHRKPGRTDIQAPTTLVYGSPDHGSSPNLNTTHQASAQNLAPASANPAPFTSSGPQQGPATGLFLGFTGSVQANGPGSNSPAGSLGVVQNFASQPAPQAAPPAAIAAPAAPHADAFINFGTSAYAEANSLTSGTAQPFFSSPVYTHLFGASGPTSTDIANFETEVISTIKSTYNNAGLAIHLTTDPTAIAAHMMSLVSGAFYAPTPDAIGITDVGNNGFSFVDKFAGVQSAEQLAIAIGHNMSHELMHAFGIANHPEQSGPYVDAATTSLATLSDPSTGFSSEAASLLSTLNFQTVGQSVAAGAQRIDGDQILVGGASPVPEPTTIALWTLAGGLAVAHRRRKAA